MTMMQSQEWYDLLDQFEKLKPGRVDREAKDWWSKGQVYQDGSVNNLFQMYLRGYSYGKAVRRTETA